MNFLFLVLLWISSSNRATSIRFLWILSLLLSNRTLMNWVRFLLWPFFEWYWGNFLAWRARSSFEIIFGSLFKRFCSDSIKSIFKSLCLKRKSIFKFLRQRNFRWAWRWNLILHWFQIRALNRQSRYRLFCVTLLVCCSIFFSSLLSPLKIFLNRLMMLSCQRSLKLFYLFLYPFIDIIFQL